MNKEVSISSETKYLGLIIDEKVLFKSHIDIIVTKMKTFCSIFYRIGKVISTKLLVRMYKVYIEPKNTYEILIHGTASKTDLQKKSLTTEKKIPSHLQQKEIRSYFEHLG